jgi:hypothetical protein
LEVGELVLEGVEVGSDVFLAWRFEGVDEGEAVGVLRLEGFSLFEGEFGKGRGLFRLV